MLSQMWRQTCEFYRIRKFPDENLEIIRLRKFKKDISNDQKTKTLYTLTSQKPSKASLIY